MKKRLKEIEEEAGALREMQAKVEKEMGAVQGLSRSLSKYICARAPRVRVCDFSKLYLVLLGALYSV